MSPFSLSIICYKPQYVHSNSCSNHTNYPSFYLPPSPTQTASYFRGSTGWFSPSEEVIMVNRIIRDDPSKGDMHNRQALSPSLFWEALKDYDMWPIYLIGLSWSVPQIPSNSYITLIIESLGFDTFQTNLLTVPGYVLFIIQVPLWTWLSEKLNNRFGMVLVSQIWLLPILVALELLSPSKTYTWARYALNLMMLGFPYIHPILGKYSASPSLFEGAGRNKTD